MMTKKDANLNQYKKNRIERSKNLDERLSANILETNTLLSSVKDFQEEFWIREGKSKSTISDKEVKYSNIFPI